MGRFGHNEDNKQAGADREGVVDSGAHQAVDNRAERAGD